MIKNLTVIEIAKESREYHLILSPDSPLGEIFDVLTEMRSIILERIKEIDQNINKDQSEKTDE